MNRKGFIKSVSDVLRENGAKKPVSIPKQVFHISDNDGNTRDFTVKQTDKTAIYTQDDIATILDACVAVIEDSLKRGEPVVIHGFGSLGLKYREARRTKSVDTGEEITIDGHYIPKFSFGRDLRMCAKVYELSLQDRAEEPSPRYDESDSISEDGLGSHGD